MENEMGCILAQGLDGLEAVLNEIIEKSQVDPAMKGRAYMILFELGNQKSLIKMDLNEWPVVFWYYDLLGRPATSAVKDLLARFAWEKCGEKELYFKEKEKTALDSKDNGGEEEGAFAEWRKTVFEGRYEKD